MGFFKVLGGIALGVGCIAAAPFTGGGSLLAAGVSLAGSLGGVGTIAAAVAAGTAGAVAGAAASESEEEEKRRARREGKEAGQRIAEEKYQKIVDDLSQRLMRREHYEKALVGLFAVGMAVANADGICDEEREELDQFVGGIASGYLPDEIKSAIEKLRGNPPTLKQAIYRARQCHCHVEDIDDIIELVSNADGIISPEEERYIQTWKDTLRPMMLQ